jgi:D-alanyl-D-alanine carboxypeptidase
MDKWLKPALAYVPDWLDLQMRQSRQPGCIVAIAHHGRVVLQHAFGPADLEANKPLTPRHRFRVASHSCKPSFESR